jgi:transcriptional regulator with XRE-family HTH domain
MAEPRGKSFSPEQNERIRDAARQLLSGSDNRTALAAELGVSQPSLSNFLNGKTGAGPQLATAIASHLGVSLSSLIGETGPGGSDDEKPINANLPGYLEAEAEAKRISGLPAWTFQVARTRSNLIPRQGVTAQYVIDEAAQVLRYADPDEVARRTNAALDRRIKALRTREENRIKKRGAK